MYNKLILGKSTGDEYARSIDISYRNVATLHHSFIGLMERMWKALKNRDKAPFKDMDLPEIDLSNFKMKITENLKPSTGNNCDITVVRFYVRNIFDDSNRKWFSFREITLRTFLPYIGEVKLGRYDIDSMWGWFHNIKAQDSKYEQLYDEAQYLTSYLDACVIEFLGNNIEPTLRRNTIMREPKRGDFYHIRILDDELRRAIVKAEKIQLDELVLGKMYPAMLEQHICLKEGDPFFWDFCILGERAPIIQLRIMDKEIKDENVWIKFVASGGHEPIRLTAEDAVNLDYDLAADIEKMQKVIEDRKMSLGFSFENSELDWDKVRWMEELLALKESKLHELNNNNRGINHNENH